MVSSYLALSSTFLAAAVVALLWAELKSSRLGVWLTKPIASTIFVATALVAGALASSYGQLILLGLLFSWLGDVFLIPKRRLFFIAGLGSFLLAHLAYSGAFFLLPLELLPLTLAAITMAVVAITILRWLWPHLPPNLQPAVVSYVGAISLMVVLASGTVASTGPLLAVAAVMFAVSDIFVARHRFVSPSLVNKLWGLPLYYAAQLIFALSVYDR
ncbi:MAG: lysoplasmalogenase [Chloroflexi bacterium]|nr:lysoplasmalogenase [Chloroflexota bacterium]